MNENKETDRQPETEKICLSIVDHFLQELRRKENGKERTNERINKRKEKEIKKGRRNGRKKERIRKERNKNKKKAGQTDRHK